MMKTLETVRHAISTHDCPVCLGPAYCAMEDGKSSNLCWCMEVERDTHPNVDSDQCLCRRCLTEGEGGH